MPDNSAIDAPLFLSEIMPHMKSCTAPPKMEPNTIQRKTTGPKQAPMRAPKIGPVPAILSSCMRSAFQVFIGTQSTPSLISTAGVFLSSGPNTFSVN